MASRNLFIVLAVMLISTAAAMAGTLSIVVSPSGYAEYSFNGGAWLPEVAASGSWDSLVTKPDASGAASVSKTEDFALPTGFSWGSNTAATTEGADIVSSGGTTGSASVSYLLILDTGANVLLYQAPTTLNPTNSTSPVSTYGYTDGNSISYNPSTPINEVGGLVGDLENNAGMAGNGNQDNLNTSDTAAPLVIAGLGTISAYSFTGNAFSQINGNPYTTTVYFTTANLPLPNTAAVMSVLFGLVIAAGYLRSSKQLAAKIA